MNLRPAISAPLPWLTLVVGKLFGRKGENTPRRKRLLRFPRSLKVTTEGKWFIGLLLFIGIAAINTGNNLLYLVVATLLSLIIVSGILSESTLRGVKVKRVMPRYVYKNEPAMVRFDVTNRKRLFPSFSFYITDERVEGLKPDDAYVLRLDHGESTVATTRYSFKKRGLYRLAGVRVSTRFPFGIFVKGKREEAPLDILVYPMVGAPRTKGITVDAASEGTASSRRKGSGGQLYGLRNYTFADDARFIHWRSAARGSKLLLKEHEREADNRLTIVFDNYATADTEAFETLVDEAASLASHYIKRGFPVGLKTLECEVAPGRGTRKLHVILETLSLITPAKSYGVPGLKVESS